MAPEELEYAPLIALLRPYVDKGRPVSIAFLNWFLEHIYRLDRVDAEDAICDKNNDRGIDGIYVDHDRGEIHVLQSKTKQKGTIGDKDIREFSGSLNQMRDPVTLNTFLDGTVDQEIKDRINSLSIPALLEKGYAVRGVFVTNVVIDANGRDALKADPAITGFDQEAIASAFVDLNVQGGIKGEYEFESDGDPLTHQAGDVAKVVMFLAEGRRLAGMPGIQDGSLFELNVRLPLGSTKVNKAIKDSIDDKGQHQKFALFHNGVTILAEKVTVADSRVKIENFVVVNGAQSLKQFSSNLKNMTDDVKVLTRIIEIGSDADLALEISVNSNNQNGIKARDLRSNDKLQVRLKNEFEKLDLDGYRFDVKRGEESEGHVISNEYAGKLLLAFDLNEPWSCHQTYKVFDEKYAEIFGRPGVTAQRVILLAKIMEIIEDSSAGIENRPFANYGLTSYMLLASIKALLGADPLGRIVCENPALVFADGKLECVLQLVRDLMASIIVDVNHELKAGKMSDYKSDLKSRANVTEFVSELLRSYEKDKVRGKADNISERLAACGFA